jgi:hypothetical protein
MLSPNLGDQPPSSSASRMECSGCTAAVEVHGTTEGRDSTIMGPEFSSSVNISYYFLMAGQEQSPSSKVF